MASTFPRWPNDNVPPFVWEFAQHLAPYTESVQVVAPHFFGAKRYEHLTDQITIKRFHYAYPARYETVAYGQFARTRFYLFKSLSYVWAEFWTTLGVCLRTHSTVINAHWMIPQGLVGLLVARLVGARLVVSVHGGDVFMFNSRFYRAIKRFVLRHADQVVVNSSATQAACHELWPQREYRIIPMGIDVDQFAPIEHAARTKRPFEILFVGRLVQAKGVHYVCQAAQMLAKAGLNIHLTIIGTGPEQTELEDYIRREKLERVIKLEGWVRRADLPRYYHRSDVFVGPSIVDESGWKEALGLVFAEAAAAALPIITTNTGGMVDLVVDQKTGFIVPQKDAAVISKAVQYLYDHPNKARAMGSRGRALVSEYMSWERIAEQYRKLLGL